MKAVMCRIAMPLLLAVLAPLPLSSAVRMRVTPVQKVLTMLSDMKSKATKAMEEEQVTYAAYKEWVSDETTELGFSIKTATSDIERLNADIIQADSAASRLGEEVAALKTEIGRLEEEKKAATDIRTSEHDDFLKMQQDLAESVDALQHAIQVLKAQAYDRPQAEMLLQRLAKTTPGVQRALAALPQEESAEPGAPEVAGYEFQSDNIVETLEGLLDKFKQELSETQKKELNQAHFYNLEVIHLSNAIDASSKDSEEKASLEATHLANSEKAQAELAERTKAKAQDEKTKQDMEATFEAKTATFQQNQEVRKDEIKALSDAIDVISKPEVADSYSTHIKAVQLLSKSPVALLQMHSSKHRVAANELAAAFLHKRAAAISSQALESLAINVTQNPFSKVIDMMQNLLAELRDQAAAELDHKTWCDDQLKKNKLKRNEYQAEVDKLIAEIDTVDAEIAEKGKSIAQLLKEQADLKKAMEDATALRTKENAQNTATITDAKEGITAVTQAITILQEFYGGVSFAQTEVGTSASQVPELASYKGLHDEKKGVIGMLEVILTDFGRLETDTTAAENQAANEYATFMKDAEADVKAKHDLEFQTSLAKDRLEFDLSNLQKDLKANQDELAVAYQYYEYLKPNCVQIPVNYEDRKAHREEEIEALKQAYEILDQKSKEE